MPDYIHIDDLPDAIHRALVAVAEGSRLARIDGVNITLLPEKAVFSMMVLYEANAVETHTLSSPPIQTETVIDSPALVSQSQSRSASENGSGTTTTPGRTTTLTKNGNDTVTTDKEYEDFDT